MLKKLPSLLLLAPVALVMLVVLTWHEGTAAAASGATERVSVDSTGNQGNDSSSNAAISADGRYVAFESAATNLVLGDTNVTSDVFVRDRQTGATERVSVDSTGNEGNDRSSNATISADGRYVAFESSAANLAPGDTNFVSDIFVRDRVAGTTERVSVDSTGNQGNDSSSNAAISADGRYVAFESSATKLAPGDSNFVSDVFVRDRVAGTTERISVDSTGNQGDGGSYNAAISDDGRHVAFESDATNLAPGDTNFVSDVFVRDRVAGTTERVSVNSSANQGDGGSYNAAISADGRYVAFESDATNLALGDTNLSSDVFVRDRVAGTTERVSVDSSANQGNDGSYSAAISADGRSVAFQSDAANLVLGDTNVMSDVFVRDRVAGTTERVSVDSSANQGDDGSYVAVVSADGRYVAFQSDAANLAPGDTNVASDVFVHDRSAAPTPTPVGQGAAWGDVDCSGDVAPRDGQAILKNVLVQNALSQTEPCPDVGSQVTVDGVSRIWGDVDCSGEVAPRDGQAILKNVLVQSALSQTEPCPDVGSKVTLD